LGHLVTGLGPIHSVTRMCCMGLSSIRPSFARLRKQIQR
jgi:hypothetical protein